MGRPLVTTLRVRDPGDMQTRPAVAVTVLTALAGAAGIVVEAAFGIVARKAAVAVAVGVAVGVTITAVAAFAPARPRLHSWADRAVFGERVSGCELLTQFGTTFGHAYRLDELAPQMAATLVRDSAWPGPGFRCACRARTGSWLPGPGHRTVPASGPGRVTVVCRWPGWSL